MTYPEPNPPITPLVRWVIVLGVLVLAVAGGGLFFLPDQLGPLWPWVLAPFNTRFLGAVYLAALAPAIGLAATGRRAPARLVLPMIFGFTAVMLIVSLVYGERFTENPVTIVFWFVIYVVVPAVVLYELWRHRDYLLSLKAASPPPLTWLLGLQAIVLGVYGMLLLALPGIFGAFWPWPLDDFHARLYSTAFLIPALGAWLLLRGTARLELGLLGLSQVVGNSCIVIGLIVVDAAVQRVDWNTTGTLIWIGLFGGGFAAGALMLWHSITWQETTPSPAQ